MTDFVHIQLGIDAQLGLVQTFADRNGAVARSAWSVDRYRGFGLKDVEGPVKLDDYGLLIPCDRKVTSAIRDFMDMQVVMAPDDDSGNTYFGPYYFSGDMTRNSRYEPNPYAPPGLFAGEETAYYDVIAEREYKKPGLLARLFNRHAENGADAKGFRNARYNCWTASQGITQYVGGVDLSRIHRDFAHSYRVWQANAAHIELSEALRDGTAPDYRAHVLSDRVILAQKGDNPPFILFNKDTSLSEVLALKMPDSNMTLSEWLAQQTLFTSLPLAEHEHMKERRAATPRPPGLS